MKQNLTITISPNLEACNDKLARELADNFRKKLHLNNLNSFTISGHKFKTGLTFIYLTQFDSTVTILIKYLLFPLDFLVTRVIKTFKIIKSINICNQ